jgi:hypothetical protein
VVDLEFERPFYELIIDGIHSHPNSVRVCPSDALINGPTVLILMAAAGVQRIPRRMHEQMQLKVPSREFSKFEV